MENHGQETPLLATGRPEQPPLPSRNKYPLICATLASMTTILMGYNLALMSGAQIFIKEDLGISDTQIEILAGSMNIFLLVSVFVAGWTADHIGRRLTIVLANAFFLAGAAVFSLGMSYAMLIAGRFITSIGVGFSLVIAPVYTAEIAPASSRGQLSSLPEICVNLGIFLSYVSNYALSGLSIHLGWRVMFAIGILPPIFLAIGVLAMPESPRWLAMRHRLDEARQVLIRTSETADEADLRLQDIQNALISTPDTDKQPLLKPTPNIRRILGTILGLNFFQQGSGIDVIVLYTPLVFKKAGISSNSSILAATIVVGVAKAGFVLVGTFLTDRVGRRPLLIASTAGITTSLFVLALALEFATMAGNGISSSVISSVCVVSVIAYVAAFSIGLGPITSAYGSEILPLRLRAQGVSLGLAMNRITCGLVSMTYISLYEAISMPGSFFLYATVSAAACVFVCVSLPETRGRSLEDMEMLFAK